MSELPSPSPNRTSGFGDPASVFPEFAAQNRKLEKVTEEEGEGEDQSSYGNNSFDLTSSSISRSESRNAQSLKLSRFSEEEEIDSNSDFRQEKRDWSGCYRRCCAYTCLILSIFLIIILLGGLSLNASIESKLPQVIVTNLKFTRLDFTKTSTDLLMNSNLTTVLQLSNVNDKATLYYTPMRVDISSENINLGQKNLVGFNQPPGNVTSLKIVTRLRNVKVYDVDATLLRNKEKNREALVNVLVSGKLSFDWLGIRVHLSIVIACEDVKESDVLNGLKPNCDVRIFSNK